MTSMTTSCHCVNESCAISASHNVVNFKFHVIFLEKDYWMKSCHFENSIL